MDPLDLSRMAAAGDKFPHFGGLAHDKDRVEGLKRRGHVPPQQRFRQHGLEPDVREHRVGKPEKLSGEGYVPVAQHLPRRAREQPQPPAVGDLKQPELLSERGVPARLSGIEPYLRYAGHGARLRERRGAGAARVVYIVEYIESLFRVVFQ